MAKKDDSRMPSGMAGIVKYGDEPKDTIKIKPEYIVYFTFGMIAIELFLKFYV